MSNKLAIKYARVLRQYVDKFDSLRSFSNKHDVTYYNFMVDDTHVNLIIDCVKNNILLYDDKSNFYFIHNERDLRTLLYMVYRLERAE